MTFLRFFSPARAYRDLRLFMGQRHPHELLFLTLSIVITGFLVIGFIKDSHIPTPYKRNIIYVQSWPANRSEAEILAQQKIDAPKEAKLRAEEAARRKKVQDDFKRIDNQLDAWGL